jgi:hypothetical protein
MNKLYYFFFMAVWSNVISASFLSDPLNTMISLIRPKQEEQILYKSYECKPHGGVTINNSNGSIKVTSWNKPTVSVKAIKHAGTKEQLALLTIKETVNDNKITIAAICHDPSNSSPSIDYEVTVPKQTAITLSTENGSITLQDIAAPINVTTHFGTIDIQGSTNTIAAVIVEKGNIAIKSPRNAVQAITNKGSVTITDACNSIVASTENGTISLDCTQLPSTGKINLTSTYGDINLSLPSNVNADFHARTTYGTLTCQHHITLKPFTTQLDRKAWRRFKKEVDGVLGTGEAQISIVSYKSHIRVLKTKIG